MNSMLNRYINILKGLSNEEYMFVTILTTIAPVLCGIKCGSLVNITDNNRKMKTIWKNKGNVFLERIKLSFFVFEENDQRLLVYFYNKDKLKKILWDPSIKVFLKNYGYTTNGEIEDILLTVKKRFQKVLPHEIGLFLGIPLRDVLGYIDNNGLNYLYCGFWKVYNDVNYSLKIFEKYKYIRFEVMKLIAGDFHWTRIIYILEMKFILNAL